MTSSRSVPVAASLVLLLALAQTDSAWASSGSGVPAPAQKPTNQIPPAPPPPPGSAVFSQATLVLQTDAPCGLSIAGPGDDLKLLDLPLGTTEIGVPPGEITVVCSVSDQAVDIFSKTVTVTAGQRILVNIQLAASIAKATGARQHRCNAEADHADPDGRFKATAAGTLTDSQTGLQWTQTDNGKPINWKQASHHCSAMKGGWRLPTVDELSGLYSSCVSQQCFAVGGAQYSCHVSGQFRLTGIGYWSSQSQGSGMALAVGFDGDAPDSGASIAADADDGERALCVRHP